MIAKHSNFISVTIVSLATLIAAIILFAGSFATPALAQLENISFPIAELGNCGNKDECKRYCERPENITACIDFGERNNLMTREEAERSREFKQVIDNGKGPGSCSSPAECELYCYNIENLRECVDFADQEGLHGIEQEDSQKLLEYLDNGGKMPGGCTTEESCSEYCDDFANMRECTAFMNEVGFEDDHEHEEFLDDEEIERLELLFDRGETPGSCRSWEECDHYCMDDTNHVECFEFAVKAGFVSKEEAEMFEKTGGKGPGGCVGEAECEQFCSSPEGAEVCHQFAIEHGFIDEHFEDEFHEYQEFDPEHHDDMFGGLPPEVADCVGSETDRKNTLDHDERKDIVEHCFENFEPHYKEHHRDEFTEYDHHESFEHDRYMPDDYPKHHDDFVEYHDSFEHDRFMSDDYPKHHDEYNEYSDVYYDVHYDENPDHYYYEEYPKDMDGFEEFDHFLDEDFQENFMEDHPKEEFYKHEYHEEPDYYHFEDEHFLDDGRHEDFEGKNESGEPVSSNQSNYFLAAIFYLLGIEN